MDAKRHRRLLRATLFSASCSWNAQIANYTLHILRSLPLPKSEGRYEALRSSPIRLPPTAHGDDGGEDEGEGDGEGEGHEDVDDDDGDDDDGVEVGVADDDDDDSTFKKQTRETYLSRKP